MKASDVGRSFPLCINPLYPVILSKFFVFAFYSTLRGRLISSRIASAGVVSPLSSRSI